MATETKKSLCASYWRNLPLSPFQSVSPFYIVQQAESRSIPTNCTKGIAWKKFSSLWPSKKEGKALEILQCPSNLRLSKSFVMSLILGKYIWIYENHHHSVFLSCHLPGSLKYTYAKIHLCWILYVVQCRQGVCLVHLTVVLARLKHTWKHKSHCNLTNVRLVTSV